MTTPHSTSVFDRYKPERLLKSGSFGRTILFRDIRSDTRVAIKFIPDTRPTNEISFQKEQEALRRLQHIDHPNIVNYLDYGTENIDTEVMALTPGRYSYIVMTYIPGLTLRDHVGSTESPSDNYELFLRTLFKGLLAGLLCLKSIPIVHRDLHPNNIMIEPSGSPRIVDFGVARFPPSADARTIGRPVGHFQFAAPEVLANKDIAFTADLYSFGVLAFYAITFGTLPYEKAHSPDDILTKDPDDPRRRFPYVAPEAAEFINTLLSRNPNSRIIKHDDIDTFIDGLPLWIPSEYWLGDEPAVELVKSEHEGKQEHDNCILLHTIHGGISIPRAATPGLSLHWDDELETQRDMGVYECAQYLAKELSLSHYCRVRIARHVLDFGRFFGVTAPAIGAQTTKEEHLSRRALKAPLTWRLRRSEQRKLLHYYVIIADYFDRLLNETDPDRHLKQLMIGLHTYNRFNPFPGKRERTERPYVSLLYVPTAYQAESRMPPECFDPLFPHELGEYTCGLDLIVGIVKKLQKKKIWYSHNIPYTLPEGSVEVRSQVWSFFRFLEHKIAETEIYEADPTGMAIVFDILKDTSQKKGLSDLFRLRCHRLMSDVAIPVDEHENGGDPLSLDKENCVFVENHLSHLFERVEASYERLERWLERNSNMELMTEFRESDFHLNALAVDIRKDIVFDNNETRLSTTCETILQCLARAIIEFAEL